jgi:hypothetical protein
LRGEGVLEGELKKEKPLLVSSKGREKKGERMVIDQRDPGLAVLREEYQTP